MSKKNQVRPIHLVKGLPNIIARIPAVYKSVLAGRKKNENQSMATLVPITATFAATCTSSSSKNSPSMASLCHTSLQFTPPDMRMATTLLPW